MTLFKFIQNRPHRPALPAGFVFLAALALSLFAGRAQDGLRASLAGEAALAEQKKALANTYYNLKLGALKLRMESSFSVDTSDNVNLSQSRRQADISFKPEVDVTATLPVSEKNALTLTMGVGYQKFLRSKNLDSIFFTPNSILSFNIYTGDFVVNLHSRFNYTKQTYEQSQITDQSTYGLFESVSGISATWDLEKFIFIFGYDHDIYSPTETQDAFRQHASELVSARGVFCINPTTQLGLELSGSLTAYDVRPAYHLVSTNISTTIGGILYTLHTTNKIANYNFLSDQKSVSFGPYFKSKLSRHITFTAATGYALYLQEYDSSFGTAGTTTAFYTTFNLTHTVNSQFGYTLSGGHQIQAGLNSDTLDSYFTDMNINWHILRKTSVSTPVHFEYDSTTGLTPNKYTYLTFGLNAGYQLNSKTEINGAYTHRTKKSDRATDSYDQNQLVLTMHYKF